MAKQFDTYVAALTCTRCGHHFAPRQVSYTCPTCPPGEGLLDVEFDLGRVHHDLAWSDLLNAPAAMWRYGPLLPVAGCHLGREWPIGSTPLYASASLASFVGLQRLLVKDDSRNPNGSVEDRAACLAAIRAADAGAKALATAGPAPGLVATAAWSAAAAVPAVLFAGADESPELEARAAIFGATVLRLAGGPEVHRALCIAACDAFGWYCAVDGYNPYLVEGRKTIGLEIAEACLADPPDWIAVGPGQAATVVAIDRALRQMNRLELIDWMPRLLAPPAPPRDPYAERAHRAVIESGGIEVELTEAAVDDIRREAGRRTGLALGLEAAGALALVRTACSANRVARGESVVVCATDSWRGVAATTTTAAAVVVDPSLEAVRDFVEGRGPCW